MNRVLPVVATLAERYPRAQFSPASFRRNGQTKCQERGGATIRAGNKRRANIFHPELIESPPSVLSPRQSGRKNRYPLCRVYASCSPARTASRRACDFWISDRRHDMLMRLYHTRYSEQIETTDAATMLSQWISLARLRRSCRAIDSCRINFLLVLLEQKVLLAFSRS